MKNTFTLLVVTIFIQILQAGEVLEHPDLKVQRYFFPVMVDKLGSPTIGVDLYIGGYSPALTMDQMISLPPRSCPEALVRDQFHALQKGDLESVLSLYEEGASKKDATRQYTGNMEQLAALRKGGEVAIISQVRLGPVASIYFNNTFSDGTKHVWWETARVSNGTWSFAKGFGNSHFLTTAVNLQSKSKSRFIPGQDMMILDVSVGSDGKGIIVPSNSEKYAAKIAIRMERFIPPIGIEQYEGKDSILIFLKETISLYRAGESVKLLNNRWSINAWEAFSDDRPIDLFGWYRTPSSDSSKAFAYGRIESKQGWIYLIGNKRALSFFPVRVSDQGVIRAASGIIDAESLDINIMLLIDQTLERAAFLTAVPESSALAPRP